MLMKLSFSTGRFCALFAVLLLTSVLPVQAGTIPVLDVTAKHRPQKTIAKPSADQNLRGWISLGNHRSIAAVKRRIRNSTTSAAVTRLPNIKKQITSKSVIIMDAETGDTIFSKAPDNPRQPASTIKVLTGIIAITTLDNNETVGVSRHASGMPRSKIYLDTRKQYKVDDLINAVLLASANDASVALAEKIGGSEENFARMMTLRAKLWGAKNTICRTASGLTAKGQHSTARDLATIFRRLMRNKDFARRMQKTKVTTSYGKTLRNHNKALWRIKGADGGKTGYTAAARQTYVGKFTREGGSIIVAVMGSETMWSDVKNLVEYGFQRKQQIARTRMEKTRIAQAD